MSMQIPVFEHPPIDIHSHFNHGSPFDCPQDPIHIRALEFIKADCDRFGFAGVGMSTYASVLGNLECIVEENQYLHQLVAQEEWMYQWVVIDPRQEETYKQAEKMLSNPKVLGIKIHPSCHGYDMLEYGDALFSFAQKHKTVLLMHPQHIPEMPEFADKYPDMKLIIAHLGTMKHIDAVANSKAGNVYVDTSGGSCSLNNVVEYAVSRIGSEKMLFGTDTYACAYSFSRIALADIPQEDKENILWKNALRMFPDRLR